MRYTGNQESDVLNSSQLDESPIGNDTIFHAGEVEDYGNPSYYLPTNTSSPAVEEIQEPAPKVEAPVVKAEPKKEGLIFGMKPKKFAMVAAGLIVFTVVIAKLVK